eukprot:GHVT01026006.1.p1 GENE.GHVT01026006.1~~GHVT01026006.1.p1  ORF type:complete len:100 (-),score=3.36 GHVT01026006.1:333-632(-)
MAIGPVAPVKIITSINSVSGNSSKPVFGHHAKTKDEWEPGGRRFVRTQNGGEEEERVTRRSSVFYSRPSLRRSPAFLPAAHQGPDAPGVIGKYMHRTLP